MTTKNVPLEPTEAMIYAGDDMAEVTASVTAIYKAMIEASPAHDGEAVYQLHDGGNLWLDVSYEAFNYAPSDQARRIVHTAPPRVVDGAMILRAARVLADRSAKECNVDPDDNWNVYSETYIADAEQALKAAIGES